jgi:hypothetical protein
MQDWRSRGSSARVERVCTRQRPLRCVVTEPCSDCADPVGIVLEKNEIAFNNTRRLDPSGDAGGTKFTRTDGMTSRQPCPGQLRRRPLVRCVPKRRRPRQRHPGQPQLGHPLRDQLRWHEDPRQHPNNRTRRVDQVPVDLSRESKVRVVDQSRVRVPGVGNDSYSSSSVSIGPGSPRSKFGWSQPFFSYPVPIVPGSPVDPRSEVSPSPSCSPFGGRSSLVTVQLPHCASGGASPRREPASSPGGG